MGPEGTAGGPDQLSEPSGWGRRMSSSDDDVGKDDVEGPVRYGIAG